MRPELAHDPHERLARLLQRHEGEAAVGQRRERVALGQAGVVEPEPGVLNAQDVACRVHLTLSDGREVGQHDRVSGQRRVEHVATLAPGAAHHQHLDALADVAGHRGGALARLVVGMGMHGQQPQGVRHAQSPEQEGFVGDTSLTSQSDRREGHSR